jgi:hypothetical protein
MIMAAFEVLRALWKMIWEGLVMIFVLAATVSIVLIAVVFLLFQVLKTTVNLDSGVAQLAASVICNQSGQSTGNPTANAAVCIAQVLSGCQLNPLFAKDYSTPKWKCVVAGLLFPGAVEQLQLSSFGDGWTSEKHLQCVGLAAAAEGAGFPQTDACNYAKDGFLPKGYTFSQQCRPGSLFVDAHSCPGHIGVVLDCNAGSVVKCVDANLLGPGLVRGPDKNGVNNCSFEKSKISGYVNKN